MQGYLMTSQHHAAVGSMDVHRDGGVPAPQRCMQQAVREGGAALLTWLSVGLEVA